MNKRLRANAAVNKMNIIQSMRYPPIPISMRIYNAMVVKALLKKLPAV